MAKRNKGRQKLEMVKMENEINLQVTFSKRRFGLFKKASELVTLCGAEVALIVFSPGGKVYTFGHPTLQTIIQKYVHGPAAVDDHQSIFGPHCLGNLVDEAQRAILAVDLGHELNNKENLLESEKKVGEIMGQRIKNSSLYNRWGKLSVDELNLLELYQYKMSLEELKMDIDTVKVKKALEMNTTPNTTDLFFGRNFEASCFGFNKTNNNTLPYELPDSIFSSSVLHQNLGASSTSSGDAAGSSFPPPGYP